MSPASCESDGDYRHRRQGSRSPSPDPIARGGREH
jgi:hypothetical protein